MHQHAHAKYCVLRMTRRLQVSMPCIVVMTRQPDTYRLHLRLRGTALIPMYRPVASTSMRCNHDTVKPSAG